MSEELPPSTLPPSTLPSPSLPSRKPEVDARFLLANERTLLAWVRTALTIIAGGVGVQQFGHIGGRRGVAVGLVVLGAFGATAGTIRYHRADRAIRRGQLPPVGAAPTIVAVSVVCIAMVLLIAIASN